MPISAVFSWFLVVWNAAYQSACGVLITLMVKIKRLVALLRTRGRRAFYGVFDVLGLGAYLVGRWDIQDTGMDWYGGGMAYRLVTGMRYWYGGGYLYPLPYRHTRGLDIGCFLATGMESVHTSWWVGDA